MFNYYRHIIIREISNPNRLKIIVRNSNTTKFDVDIVFMANRGKTFFTWGEKLKWNKGGIQIMFASKIDLKKCTSLTIWEVLFSWMVDVS